MTGPANERLERKRGIRAGVDGFVGLRGDTATPIIEDAKPVRGVVTLLGLETVPKEKEVMLFVPQTISLKLGRMVGQTVGFWVRGLRQCKHTRQREFRVRWIGHQRRFSSRAILGGYVTTPGLRFGWFLLKVLVCVQFGGV